MTEEQGAAPLEEIGPTVPTDEAGEEFAEEPQEEGGTDESASAPQLYGGKFKTPEDILAAYQELEQLEGRHKSELGEWRSGQRRVEGDAAPTAPATPPVDPILQGMVQDNIADGWDEAQALARAQRDYGRYQQIAAQTATQTLGPVLGEVSSTVFSRDIANVVGEGAGQIRGVNHDEVAQALQAQIPQGQWLNLPADTRRQFVTMIAKGLAYDRSQSAPAEVDGEAATAPRVAVPGQTRTPQGQPMSQIERQLRQYYPDASAADIKRMAARAEKSLAEI